MNKRSLKIGLSAVVLLAVVSGCVTQRRCLDKFPPAAADTIIVESVTYRDTTITVTLPADTIRDSVMIYVDVPAQDIPPASVTVRNDYAQATARIEHNQLKVDLILNERRLEILIDSAAELRTKTVTITETVIQKERYVPAFYKATLFISIILILLFLAGIYISLRR